jgi:hypothetical protein
MAEFAGKRHKRFAEKPDGSTVIVRPAYRPQDFAFPSTELEHFDHIREGNYGGSEDVLDEYDGPLSYYHQVRRFERDGKSWILLQHSDEYAIEVELTRRQMGEIRPLPPEQAWRLARELDEQETRHPIEVEPGSALP